MLYFQFLFHYHSLIPKVKLFSTTSFQKKKKTEEIFIFIENKKETR